MPYGCYLTTSYRRTTAPSGKRVSDAAHDVERLGAVDGRLAEAGQLVPVDLDVGRVAGVQGGVGSLDDGKGGLVVDAILVEDEAASGYGVHLGIRRDHTEGDLFQGDDGGQVVELRREDFPGPGPES